MRNITITLPVCQELTPLAAHATQIFLESADSITSSTLPDPDIVAIHIRRRLLDGSLVPANNEELRVRLKYQMQKCLGLEEFMFVMLVWHDS